MKLSVFKFPMFKLFHIQCRQIFSTKNKDYFSFNQCFVSDEPLPTQLFIALSCVMQEADTNTYCCMNKLFPQLVAAIACASRIIRR